MIKIHITKEFWWCVLLEMVPEEETITYLELQQGTDKRTQPMTKHQAQNEEFSIERKGKCILQKVSFSGYPELPFSVP